MSELLGDVKINGNWYRIDLPSYRDRDIVDFAPKAASPGGGIIHSELMLYQPLMQTDWRHGFGFPKFEDPMGYFSSTGDIDTRHDGIAMMFTKAYPSTEMSAPPLPKVNGVCHGGSTYFWGRRGITRFDGRGASGTYTQITASSVPNTNTMFSLGENLFASPYGARLRTTAQDGKVIIQPTEAQAVDSYMDENNKTTNYATSSILKIGTVGTAKHSTAYLKFNLGVTKIPAGATVNKVTLTLMCMARTLDTTGIKIARCKRVVAETSVDWEHYATTNSWDTGGGQGAGDIYGDTADLLYSGTPSTTARSFVTIDLDKTNFASLVASNNGMIIYDTYAGTETRNNEYCSSSEANEDWRPYLTVEYTLVGEWADAGQASATDFAWSAVHNGYVYLGVRDTNRVHYSSDVILSDLQGTVATDPAHIDVGAGSQYTTGAISFLGSLYIARPDGLWQLGEDKVAKRVLDFSSETSTKNFKSMVIHNGYLVFSVRDVIYQWNGSRLTRISPPRLNNTWPYLTYGSFQNFTVVGDFLYCTARTNEDVYTESILCYDGIAWHKLKDIITDGLGKATMLFYDVNNNYLWYHVETGSPASQSTFYIPFQSNSKYPYPGFATTGTHSLYSSIHDMGFARVTKSSPSILVEGYNLSSTTYLILYYALDGGEWRKWGTIKDDGITELVKPNGLNTVEYKRIQLRVDFYTATTAQSPILEGLTLRFLMRPDMAIGWNFNIVLADHFVYGDKEDTRTAWQILKDIRTARNSKMPIEFIDLDGQVYQAYVTAYARSAQERNGDEENETVPSIESSLNVNIVEAK